MSDFQTHSTLKNMKFTQKQEKFNHNTSVLTDIVTFTIADTQTNSGYFM